ncbi:DinB family protein [bacterium]|nr:MAG: DinB family protein [bacterium]
MNLSEQIAQLKKSTEESKADLLKTFEFVPDEKLTWSPTESARSPIWIVAHCGGANAAFAAILRGEPLPMPEDPVEASAMIRNTGRDVQSREEAVKSVEESTAALIAALDGVTEEMTNSMTPTPFGPMPFRMWMEVPAPHMSGHARQIDYIQTIWGDLQDHM